MQTKNWYVITGAPCSGKTTVICALERMGYRVVHEVARAYIDDELRKGKNIDQMKSDIEAFEGHILDEKLKIEASLPEESMVFLDRGVPDSIAYFRFEGLDPGDPVRAGNINRYKRIFFFERLGFEKDPVRSEDDDIAARLDALLKESYRMLGYEVIFVPLLTVEERVDFIFRHL